MFDNAQHWITLETPGLNLAVLAPVVFVAVVAVGYSFALVYSPAGRSIPEARKTKLVQRSTVVFLLAMLSTLGLLYSMTYSKEAQTLRLYESSLGGTIVHSDNSPEFHLPEKPGSITPVFTLRKYGTDHLCFTYLSETQENTYATFCGVWPEIVEAADIAAAPTSAAVPSGG